MNTKGKGECKGPAEKCRTFALFMANYAESNSLATCFPAVAAEWDTEKNGDLTPYDISFNSKRIVWWKFSECGHELQSSVSSRVNSKHGCPYCRGIRLLRGFNDLATRAPELANQFDTERNNGLTASDIPIASGKYLWWKCEFGHSWNDPLDKRLHSKSGCPICAGKTLLPGFNDLATRAPELALEWDYTHNGTETPENTPFCSSQKVFWKCPNGHIWKASCSLRTKSGRKCPYCRSASGNTDSPVQSNRTEYLDWMQTLKQLPGYDRAEQFAVKPKNQQFVSRLATQGKSAFLAWCRTMMASVTWSDVVMCFRSSSGDIYNTLPEEIALDKSNLVFEAGTALEEVMKRFTKIYSISDNVMNHIAAVTEVLLK